ncbi:MAG TPA: metal-dependent transcriptional regulator [Chloroflexota bacterium]|nr:metal-dependent transcriptional regulator [Chloroflexota bacterium]
MPTAVIEDYLEQIYLMELNGARVIGARLAERMHTAVPTTTETLKRMVRNGLVWQNEHKEVQLTADGRTAAESAIRRHALSERLLTDILGLSWVEAHAEAHKFEHIISPKVEARLMTLLGNPNTCPHGNPIPTGSGDPPLRGLSLAEQPPGDYQVLRISEDAENDVALMAYIEEQQLKPGADFRVISREPFAGPVVVEVQGERHALGAAVAEAIFVRRASPYTM